MLIYIFIYFTSSVMAIYFADRKQISSNTFIWVFVGMSLTIFIGFRHQVGGDWYNYLSRFQEISDLTFENTLKKSDVGYQFLVFFMNDWGFEIYAVNFVSAILFTAGLIVFLRKELNPWLGLTVAIPYLIIVVSMGYTRQGVALGLVMWGLASLERKKFVRFLVLITIAASFHKSAVLMIAFGMFTQGRGKLFKIVAVVVAGIGIWLSFVEESSSTLWKNYVEEEMQSEGAKIRVMLNFIPAVLLFTFRKKWKIYFNDYSLWVMVALASIVSIFAVNFSSTAVDRMALYFIPIQIVVYSRLPFLAKEILSPKVTSTLIVLFYGLILIVWLNYATHAYAWVNYKNMLFMDLL